MSRTTRSVAIGHSAAWIPCHLLAALLLAGPAQAQAPVGDIVYSRQQTFRIPFRTDPGERRIQQVELFVSTDQGRNWQSYANAVPNAGSSEGSFLFTATRDATYYFAVRTIDFQGQRYPATLDALRAGLKVCVDTQPPVVVLRPLPGREGMVGVSWDIRDENLNPASLRLDYRLTNSVEWQPVPVDAPAAVTPQPPPSTVTPPEQAVRMVNSKHISLEYDVQEVGPSGIVVELWYTQDGRNWQKYKEQRDPPKPYIFSFDVNDEGTYGFSLVVRSGVGLGGRPPQVGDAPQVWVEVDLKPPVVQVLGVEVGRGADAGNLTIVWRATDKNLGRQPINLSYTAEAGGTWTTIATGIENTGRYIWRMPEGVPYRFRIRVEASDRAGNSGSAEWGQDVIVDLKVPKINIINVTPVPK